MPKKTSKATKATKTASTVSTVKENKQPKAAANSDQEKAPPAKPKPEKKEKPAASEESKKAPATSTTRDINAWNNQQAPPVGVIVKGEGGEKFETTTRSQAFARSDQAVVFVEGLPQPVPLSNVKRTR